MTATDEQQIDALDRAENGESLANYEAIFEGFIARGIPEEDIKPRVNVFTYNAWKAKGRQVKKRPADVKRGEYGVRIETWITCQSKQANPETGEKDSYRRRNGATVFHISQTEPIQATNGRGHRAPVNGFDNEGHARSHYDPTGFYASDGSLLGRRNANGRCEDAPCCGCCT